MRTIKFRVKNEAGDWKFLNLKTQFPNTLGQFTDFFDCNDNPIFEGDIVKLLTSSVFNVNKMLSNSTCLILNISSLNILTNELILLPFN